MNKVKDVNNCRIVVLKHTILQSSIGAIQVYLNLSQARVQLYLLEEESEFTETDYE